MATTEEKQRRKQLAEAEMARRQQQGWAPQKRPLAQLAETEKRIQEQKAASEKKIQEQKATSEEEEAKRIAQILGGLKQGAQTAGAATLKGAKATGRGLKAGGKWTYAAGGAAAGYGAAKLGGAKDFMKEDWRRTKDDIEKAKAAAGKAKEVIKAHVTANYANLFLLVCLTVFIVDFINEFNLSVGLRFAFYLALAFLGMNLFDRKEGVATHLLIVYLSFSLAAFVLTSNSSIIPSSWSWAWIFSTIFYLAMFFYPAIKLGLNSFLVSGLAFAAPIVPGVFGKYIAPISFLKFSISSKFGVDLVATLLALSWIFYLTVTADWKSLLGYKPFPIKVISFAVILLLFTGTYGAFSNIMNQADVQQNVFGTIDASAVAWKTQNAVLQGSKEALKDMKEIPGKVNTKSKKVWTQYMDYATGGIYSSNVNTENLKNWVVTVTDAYAWQGKYSPNEKVTVEAVFSGTRKENEVVKVTGISRISFGCRTRETEGASPITGTAEPDSIYLISLLGGQNTYTGKQSVVCNLQGIGKSKTVDIFGTFSHSAKSELPLLITTPDKISSLVNSQQIKNYKLKPLAESVGDGPVTIAIEFEEAYPVIAEPGKSTPILITVEDHDDYYGRIQGLSDFTLELPKGMKLENCRVKTDKKTITLPTSEKQKLENGNKLYSVDPVTITYPLENYAGFKCNLAFTEEVNSAFEVGSNKEKRDIATLKVIASTKYTYEIARGVRIEIPETPPSVTSNGTTTGGSGFAGDENSPVTKITASEKQIGDYLQKNAGTQLKDKGPSFYKIGVDNGIDPAFGVAVSQAETSLSKQTCSSIPTSCNNFFCMSNDAVGFTGLSTGPCGGSRWAGFNNADDGIKAFFIYIKEKYVKRTPPQLTPAQITCAPGSGVTTHCYCENCPEWAKNVANYRAAVSGTGSSSGKCASIVAMAEKYKGCPYSQSSSPGRLSPENCRGGFTCATFIQSVMQYAGYPVTSGDGAEICSNYISSGKAVEVSKSDLKPGDVISIKEPAPNGHAAIYYGNGNVIHSTSAPCTGSSSSTPGVVISPLDGTLGKRSAVYCRLKGCT